MPDGDDSGSSSSNSPFRDSSEKGSDWRSKAKSAGSSLRNMGKDESDRASSISSSIRPVPYKRGGKVRKTGPAILHKNERVVPASKRKKTERLMKRSGMSLTNKKRGGRKASGR